MNNHDVVNDPSFTGHDRFTCRVCREQVCKQPYMTENQWEISLKEFLTKHTNPKQTDP